MHTIEFEDTGVIAAQKTHKDNSRQLLVTVGGYP
jgi:hypothetical protein